MTDTDVANPSRNSSLWIFTQAVLSGKTRASTWNALRNLYFPGDTTDASWALLRTWAEAHEIRWAREERRVGKGTETWIIFAIRPTGPEATKAIS
jgi:hypothetical protein